MMWLVVFITNAAKGSGRGRADVTADMRDLRWMSVRRRIPGETERDGLGPLDNAKAAIRETAVSP
jgi:hypothetical protein